MTTQFVISSIKFMVFPVGVLKMKKNMKSQNCKRSALLTKKNSNSWKEVDKALVYTYQYQITSHSKLFCNSLNFFLIRKIPPLCWSGSWETGIWPGKQWAVQSRLQPDHLDSLTKQATFSPSKCIPLKELLIFGDLPGAPVAFLVSNPAKEGMHSL